MGQKQEEDGEMERKKQRNMVIGLFHPRLINMHYIH